MEAPDTYFTLEEAQALLPWLQETFDAVETLKADLARAKSQLQSVETRMQSNGGSKAEEELAEANRTVQEVENEIEERAYSVVQRDITVRSLDKGLADFPSIRDGRKVYLCWLEGEQKITHCMRWTRGSPVGNPYEPAQPWPFGPIST